MCVHLCVRHHFSGSVHVISEASVLVKLELTEQASLAGQGELGSCLSLPPQRWEQKQAQTNPTVFVLFCFVLMWVLAIKLRVSYL